MARIDAAKAAEFEALARRDERRGTRRKGHLLRRRLMQITPRSQVKGIIGYRRQRPITEVTTRHGGERPLTLGLRRL